ncbi:MAG: patatin-like phospholipase family protein [Firmicutes bacterium]|nr:patatin-like phospholipase family protein [Bacillota bacterium]MDD4263794.1 patatin-like phospholipase family protein [Bacillota bacterium]MDD4693211.1 patatin-like phospholipase family protein [Bacillota bacterium]
MRWGLSLSGGSLRGAAHIGAIKALDRHGLRPDAIGGTSAGAIVAALYASGLTGEEMESFALSIDPKKVFDRAISPFKYPLALAKIIGDFVGLDPNIKIAPGLFKGDFIAKQIRLYTMEKKFSDLEIKTVINAVDLDSGDEVVFTNGQIMLQRIQDFTTDSYLWEAVRASISLPGVFVPFNFQGRRLVDGGVAALNPVKLLKKLGLPFVVAIDVSVDVTNTPEPDNFLEVLMRSYDLLNYRKNREELRLYADRVVKAGVKGVNLKEFSKLKSVIDYGEMVMENVLKKTGTPLFRNKKR